MTPPLFEIDCAVEAEGWAGLDVPQLAARAAGAVARALSPDASGGLVALLCTDDATMAALNAQWREKDGPTNVLSFPADEMPMIPGIPRPVGDIAMGAEICAREADAKGVAMADHATHLIVHGLLHLLGYDHVEDRDAAVMESLETEILGELGITDPYGETPS